MRCSKINPASLRHRSFFVLDACDMPRKLDPTSWCPSSMDLEPKAGVPNGSADSQQVWPVGFAWIWAEDERAAAVDAVFEGLESVGQVCARSRRRLPRCRGVAAGPLISHCGSSSFGFERQQYVHCEHAL